MEQGIAIKRNPFLLLFLLVVTVRHPRSFLFNVKHPTHATELFTRTIAHLIIANCTFDFNLT